MIKELVTDDAILSQRCEPATADDAELAQDLLDTLASLDDATGFLDAGSHLLSHRKNTVD